MLVRLQQNIFIAVIENNANLNHSFPIIKRKKNEKVIRIFIIGFHNIFHRCIY